MTTPEPKHDFEDEGLGGAFDQNRIVTDEGFRRPPGAGIQRGEVAIR
jgi:hypothetical protein